MAADQGKLDAAANLLLDQIAALAPGTKHPPYLLQLAEAYAYVKSPAQPHGGSVEVKS